MLRVLPRVLLAACVAGPQGPAFATEPQPAPPELYEILDQAVEACDSGMDRACLLEATLRRAYTPEDTWGDRADIVRWCTRLRDQFPECGPVADGIPVQDRVPVPFDQMVDYGSQIYDKPRARRTPAPAPVVTP